MKPIHIFLLMFILLPYGLRAQIGINKSEANPHPSAMLDVSSTEKGLLIPRMTAQERDAIASPVTGLLVFVTDDRSFYFYRGTEWALVRDEWPRQPVDSLMGTYQPNPSAPAIPVKILSVDSTDGTVSLVDEQLSISPDGTLSLKGIDIKGASPGTNVLPLRGTNGTDKWINFRTGGNSPVGRSGIILSDQDQAHYFVYNEGQKLNIDFSTETSDNPDVANASSRMRLSSNGELEVNGGFKLVTGNEGEDKLLTSDANGNADWADPPNPSDRVAYVMDNSGQNYFGNATSGWLKTSDYTNWLQVWPGDVIIVNATFGAEVVNGSNNDPLRFRIVAEGTSGCNSTAGNPTSSLDSYQTARGHEIQGAHQWTFTPSCRGEYRFYLETDFANTDDRVIVGRVTISAVKY